MRSSWPLIVAALCGVLAFICQALAVTMPGWLAHRKKASDSLQGMFYFCEGWTECHSMIDIVLKEPSIAVWITMWITQCVGLLLLMAGMVVIMVAACSASSRWTMRNLFLYFNLSAGFLILTGVISFVNVTDALARYDKPIGNINIDRFYFSLGLAVAAIGLSWIGAFIALFYKAREEERKRLRSSSIVQPVYVSSRMKGGYSSKSLPGLPRTSFQTNDMEYQTYY